MSQALRAWWRNRLMRPLFLDRKRVAAIVSVGLVVVTGVLIAVQPASAASLWAQVRDALLILFGTILKLIIDFLGNLVVILIDVLIGIAQYNNFVNAQPVTIGWPLVRDVVNMFFIVMLLVSAFATIIGYKEFHYTRVLPKLLLMAVLINFSKTLLGLMIDFSQVLMLTFVNAFKQAAGGNCVTALHLDKVLGLRSADLGETASETLPKLIASLLLGVLLMGIMLSLVIIMIVFIAARIITLWILLIMSPIAFFALALPGKLQKGLAAFTSDFWGQLSTMLIAGPVMAFFLWLALAVAQGGAQGFQIGDQTEADTAQSNFSSEVGNPVDLMTFVVAVALMLQGVKFGLASAQTLSPALGGFLKQYATPTALAKFTGIRAAARGAYRYGLKPAAKTVDFASGGRASKVVGKAGLWASGKVGGIGAETFAGLATRRKRLVREKEANLSKITADLDPSTQLSYLRARSGMLNINPFERNGARIALAKASGSKPGLKFIAEEQKRKLAKEYPGMSEDELGVMAEGRAQMEAVKAMKVGRDTAKEVNDTKTMDWLDEKVKDSGLAPDWATLGVEVEAGRRQDAKKYLATKSASAYKDSASAMAILWGANALKDDGSVDESSEAYKLIKEKGGNRWLYVKQHLDSMTNEQRRGHFAAMAANGTDEDRKAADKVRMFAGADKDGKAFSVNLVSGKIAAGEGYVSKGIQPAPTSRRREDVIARGLETIKNTKGEAPIAVKMEMLGAGASLGQTVKFDPKQGVFENADNRAAFQMSVGNFVKQAAAGQKEGVDSLSNLDVDSMAANPKGYNEARSAAIEALKLDDLKKAFQEAVNAGNVEAQEKIRQMLQMISDEAKRVEGIQKTAKVSFSELQALAIAPNAVGTQEIWARLSNAGVGSKAQAAEYAKAVALHQNIQNDVQAQAMRGKIKDRAVAVARSAGQGVKAGVGAVGSGLSAVERAAVAAEGAVAGGVRAARQRLKETPEEKLDRFERESLRKWTTSEAALRQKRNQEESDRIAKKRNEPI